MKAKERIKKYGLKKYIEVCLHKRPTPELIQKYQEKYGKDIPIERPVRYYQSQWDAVFEDEVTGEQMELKGLWSKAHKERDDERDIDEVERQGQSKLGGSNWHLIEARYRGKRYIYHQERERKPERKPERKKKEVISAEQIAEIAKGLKMAGLSAEEIGRAIKEILK